MLDHRFGTGRQGADVQGGKQASGVDGFGVHGRFLKVLMKGGRPVSLASMEPI